MDTMYKWIKLAVVMGLLLVWPGSVMAEDEEGVLAGDGLFMDEEDFVFQSRSFVPENNLAGPARVMINGTDIKKDKTL